MNWMTGSMAAGGLALFLLAMLMMTEGLKTYGGRGLKRLLGRWTSTPLRGVAAGVLVTALVQSSTAVTVSTIGFVNAGLLNLRQALGVVFGTNLGTTMTGWLVSLVGFGFKIDAFALPLIAIGVAWRLIAGGKRHQGLGEALIGFGLFFIGLDYLQAAFANLAATFGAEAFGGGDRWLVAFWLGFLMTLLTQSSSASIAIILTAASGGLVGLEEGAAAVIGANLGTTTTTIFVALKATAAARRVALAHVGFNLITALVAFSILAILVRLVEAVAVFAGVVGNPAAQLALFHTVFNLMGVVILLPLAGRFAHLLERLFRSAEDDLARPQHLDATLATTPELALAAVQSELPRLQGAVRALATSALQDERPLDARINAVRQLSDAIVEFVGGLRAQNMPRDVSDALTGALRVVRYLDEVARLSFAARQIALAARTTPALLPVLTRAADVLSAEAAAPDLGVAFEHAYQHAKAALLNAAVARTIDVDGADTLLDELSALRRWAQQWEKAVAVLPAPTFPSPRP
ncbi:MAG: Na/Pi cotransporter family protein [Sulfuritalea sp.]|nr:Na/Pi cotransporter family protein [Sulfuritalea sp.]